MQCYAYLCWSSSCVGLDDFSRVKLDLIEGVEGADYVNASYIDVSCEARLLHLPLMVCGFVCRAISRVTPT